MPSHHANWSESVSRRSVVGRSLLLIAVVGLVGLSGRARGQEQPPLDPTYDTVHSQVAEMQAAGESHDATQAVVEQWLAGRDINQVRIEPARWCLEQCLPQKSDRNEFSVTWTGEITAPVTGQYVFSVCPINVNKSGPGETVKHSMSFFVDGKQVVNATPDKWQWQGDPIQLQANQSVPLRVEMSYSSTDGTYGDSPHALLYWQGPGLARQIVPTDALNPPENNAHGLQADYRWTEAGRPQQAVLQDPNIEFAWATCRDVAPSNRATVDTLTNQLWEACTNPAYLAEQTQEPAPKHGHVYFRNYTSNEFLSMARRREFVQLLLQSPELLKRADETQILRLYHVLRFGDSDAALDMLGTWMQQRPNVEPQIAADFFDANQRFYRTVALYLVFRAADIQGSQTLQDRYLSMGDGSCCLPAAYTLGYSNLMAGKIDEWIEQIESHLADPACVGDKRVNWLLARGHAEEIRGGPAERRYVPISRVSDGLPWIDEAALAAESDSTRVRIIRERVARLASMRKWDTTLVELNGLTRRGGDDAALADRLRSNVSQLQTAIATQMENERWSAFKSHVDELQRRREAAAARGDSSALARYDQLIEAAQSSQTDTFVP